MGEDAATLYDVRAAESVRNPRFKSTYISRVRAPTIPSEPNAAGQDRAALGDLRKKPGVQLSIARDLSSNRYSERLGGCVLRA
jgi:hypothetical protein